MNDVVYVKSVMDDVVSVSFIMLKSVMNELWLILC